MSEPFSPIADRLRTAVARLEAKRDDPSTGGYERARLEGKVQGVKLAASYIEEEERIFRPTRREAN